MKLWGKCKFGGETFSVYVTATNALVLNSTLHTVSNEEPRAKSWDQTHFTGREIEA